MPNFPTVSSVSTGLYHLFLVPATTRSLHLNDFGVEAIADRILSTFAIRSDNSCGERIVILLTYSFIPSRLVVTVYQKPQSLDSTWATRLVPMVSDSSFSAIAWALSKSNVSIMSFLLNEMIWSFSNRRSARGIDVRSISSRLRKFIGWFAAFNLSQKTSM